MLLLSRVCPLLLLLLVLRLHGLVVSGLLLHGPPEDILLLVVCGLPPLRDVDVLNDLYCLARFGLADDDLHGAECKDDVLRILVLDVALWRAEDVVELGVELVGEEEVVFAEEA